MCSRPKIPFVQVYLDLSTATFARRITPSKRDTRDVLEAGLSVTAATHLLHQLAGQLNVPLPLPTTNPNLLPLETLDTP